MCKCDVDPIGDQRAEQRRLLALGLAAVTLDEMAPCEPLVSDLEAERELRRRADVLLAGEAGEWLRASLAINTAAVAHRALATIKVHRSLASDTPTAIELAAKAKERLVRLEDGSTTDEPCRSILEFVAVAVAADRLASDR